MCQGAVTLIYRAIPAVNNAESVLEIKNLVTLFMQTMDVSFPRNEPYLVKRYQS